MKNLGKSIVAWFIGIFGAGIGKYIGVLIISMIPIIELRGAIPVGYALGLEWWESYLVSVVGNMLPVPLILLFVTKVFDFMKKHKILTKFVKKLEDKAVAKSDNVRKYQFWGLVLFVAIPLPGTGAWTGSLIAALFQLPKKKAFLSALIGVLIAGLIVTVLTYGLVDNIIN